MTGDQPGHGTAADMEVIDKVTLKTGEWAEQDSQYFQSEGTPPLTPLLVSPVLSCEIVMPTWLMILVRSGEERRVETSLENVSEGPGSAQC